ncbi:MAG: NUDIX pyrophosphatase [Chloroflexi bacterium]|nr:NUDIX pyrophosphatase [Chloroflexota bacterium]
MRDAEVVTCFLLRRGEGGDTLLLLRRSDRVSTYQGLWASVSGYLESESPLEQAYREIEEEVGLHRGDLRLLAQGEPLIAIDETIDTRWTVHPFLFEVLRPERVRLDWEHVESRWVTVEEMGGLETVPRLEEALGRVYSAP